jgi:hypothetical protein
MVGNPDEQLVEAAEELIAGDSDDPPLNEDSILGDAERLTCQRLGSMG